MRRPEEAKSDPYADYPNPESARMASGPGAIEKTIASLGIGEDREHRTSVPWGQALQSSVANFSPSNLIYSLGRASEAAKRYEPFTGDTSVGPTAATLMNTPVLGAPFAAGVKGTRVGMPGGRNLHGELPIPEEPAKPGMGHNNPPPDVPPEMPQAQDLDPLGFYSAAQRGAQNLPIGKKGWNAQQILAGLKKQPNVKAEEIKWMGLENELKAKPTWTKDELNALMEKQRVRPQKNVLEEGGGMSDEALRDSWYEDVWNETHNFTVEPDHEVVKERRNELEIEQDPETGKWHVIDDTRRADEPDEPENWTLGTYNKEYEAERAAQEHAEEWTKEIGAQSVYDGDGNRIHQGQEIYRDRDERRLLDEARQQYVEDRENDFDPDEYRREIGEESGAKHLEYLGNRPGGSEAGTNYRENVYTVPQKVLERQGQKAFTRSHYDDPNVVAHWLLHDYTDPKTGERVTFANEGQSDWRKAQTRYGVAGPPEQLAALQKTYLEADRRFNELNEPFFANPDLHAPNDQPKATSYHLIPPGEHSRLSSLEWSRRDMHNRAWRAFMRNEHERLSNPSQGPYYTPEQLQRFENDAESTKRAYNDEIAKYPAMAPEDAKAYQERLAEAELRKTEASNAYHNAAQGIPQGPWVGSIGDANAFMAKQLLMEAAKDPKSRYAAWVDPDTITSRWGSKLREQYEKHLPDTMLKWAKTHDPNAQLTKVPIGDWEGPGKAEITPDFVYNPRDPDNPPAPPPGEPMQEELPLFGGMNRPSREAIEKYPGTLEGKALQKMAEAPLLTGESAMTMSRKPADIEMTPFAPHVRQSFHGPNRDTMWGTMEPAGMYGSVGAPSTVPGFRLVDEEGRPVSGKAFRTREQAEHALQEALKFYENTPNMTLDELRKDLDLTDVPAIEMTPALRESILKKGFPLFVSGAPIAPGVLMDKHYGKEEGFADGGGERSYHLPRPGLPNRPTDDSVAGLMQSPSTFPLTGPYDPYELELAPATKRHEEQSLINPSRYLSNVPNEDMSAVNLLASEPPAVAAVRGAMRAADIFKRLRANGWRPVMNKAGHTDLTHPTHPGRISLPTDPNAAVPLSKMHDIFDRAGLTTAGDPKFPTEQEAPQQPYPDPIDWAHPFVGGRPSPQQMQETKKEAEMPDPGTVQEANDKLENAKKIGEGGAEATGEHAYGGPIGYNGYGYADGGLPRLPAYQPGLSDRPTEESRAGMMPKPYSFPVLQEPGMDPGELQHVTPPAKEEQSLTNPTPTNPIPRDVAADYLANAIAPEAGGAARVTVGMAKGAIPFRKLREMLIGMGFKENGYTGSHLFMVHPDKPWLTQVHFQYNHPNDMTPIGTLQKVYKNAGLDKRGRPIPEMQLPPERRGQAAAESTPEEYGPIDPSHVSLGNNRYYDPNNDLLINRTGPEPHAYTAEADPMNKADPETQRQIMEYLENATKRRGGRVALTAYAA